MTKARQVVPHKEYAVKIDKHGFWLISSGCVYGVTLRHAAMISQRLVNGMPYYLASPMYDMDHVQLSYFHIHHRLIMHRKILEDES